MQDQHRYWAWRGERQFIWVWTVSFAFLIVIAALLIDHGRGFSGYLLMTAAILFVWLVGLIAAILSKATKRGR